MAKKKRRKRRVAKKRTYRKVSGVGRPRKRARKRVTKRRRKTALRGIGYRPSLKRRGVRGLFPSYMGRSRAASMPITASLQRIVAPDTIKGLGAATIGHVAGMGIGALIIRYAPAMPGNMPTALSALAAAAIGEIVGSKVFKSPAAGDMAAVAGLMVGVRTFIDKPLIKLYTGTAGLYEVNGLAQVRLPEDVDVMGLDQVRVPEGVDVAGIGYSDVPDVVTEEELESSRDLF